MKVCEAEYYIALSFLQKLTDGEDNLNAISIYFNWQFSNTAFTRARTPNVNKPT